MSTARFVVVGLGHARAEWFPEVARWATTGHLPLDFVKCLSIEGLRARTSSGRRYSAALVDARLPAVDRDLIGGLADRGIPTIVVGAPAERLDWQQLGAVATLPSPFEREHLLIALEQHAATVADVLHELDPHGDASTELGSIGRLVAVTGRAGSGRSTVAAAVAQHLADSRAPGHVALVDLARRAHQALLHDAGDLVPGIQELTEACRSTSVATRDLRPFTFDIEHRGYHLVLGLRRPRDWVTIRSRAFATALESIGRAFPVVVADVDDDVEGEAQTGSFDIEDRNLMARTSLARADVVTLVARPTLTGLHGLVDSLRSLHDFGVPGGRIAVVVNRAPRSPRARAELTRTIADLVATDRRTSAYAGVVFVAERRNLDLVHHDQARMPGAVAHPPGNAVEVLLDRNEPRRTDAHEGEDHEPMPVQPGSLGSSASFER